jgi:hypothetical protein
MPTIAKEHKDLTNTLRRKQHLQKPSDATATPNDGATKNVALYLSFAISTLPNKSATRSFVKAFGMDAASLRSVFNIFV